MSRSAISVLLSLFLSAVSIAAQDVVFTQGHPDEVEITAEELADKIIEYAETFLGTPYRYGANGPRRFDCTGYTRYVFKHFGYDNLSRSSRDQAQDGREVDISDFHNLQKGDILLLGSRRNPKVVGHVGIFIGLDDTGSDPRFIHASNNGVRYSSIHTETYYANRLLGARRILPDFHDYEVEFDDTAAYDFNPDAGVHIAPDSLVLADTDRRIVLFGNGKWAYVDEFGNILIPDGKTKIILSGDGNWAPVREAKVVVPAAPLSLPSAVDTAKAPAPVQEEIYHTVVKGDTLTKIAKQHRTTVARICQLNGISTSTILKVGRKLRVR